MTDLIDIFFYASLPFSVVGIIMFIIYSFKDNRKLFAVATISSLLSFICLTLVLAVMLAKNGVEFAMASQTRYIILAWAVMVSYFIAGYIYRIRILGSLLMPVALMLMLIAMFVPDSEMNPGDTHNIPAVLGLHMVGVLGSYALLFLSTAGAILFLVKRRALKDHQNLAIESKLPALGTLHKLMSNTFLLGFPMLTAGVILGIFVIEKGVDINWLTDKKLILGWLLWISYSVLFVLFKGAKIAEKKFAWAVIVLFVFFSGYYICTKDRLKTEVLPTAEKKQEILK